MKYLQAIIVALLTALLFFAAPGYTQQQTNPNQNNQTPIPDTNNPPLPKPVGRVVWVKGALKAVMENNEERTLQKTSLIYEKDTLITDGTSEAQIVFTDNTLMTFRENTKFIISQYSYKPNSPKGSLGKYFMDLLEGGFRTITGAIAKDNPDDYQVNTPVATIGVRGTDYAVVISHGGLYVGYYTGKPCVKNKDGKRQETLCLDATTQYGYVQAAGEIPVPLMERPDVFQEKLEILPAHITPFSYTEPTANSNRPISSFCITQ